MKSIDTLGILIDDGYRLAIYCEDQNCRHWVWADLPALAERLGRDHGCLHDDFTPKLRCTKCGGRRFGIRLHPPHRPGTLRPR